MAFISAGFVESAFEVETEEVYLVLLTIDHYDLTEPIRVVNNTESIVSRGMTFIACPFDVKLPNSTDEAPPTAQLRIDNVSKEVGIALREITDSVSVKLEVVNASDSWGHVEADFSGFTLTNVVVNITSITGTLGLDNLRVEPFPANSFTPGLFPGLFK